MGGTEFYTEGEGATIDEAFRNAVKEAEYQTGHGSYSGTISEKSGDGFVLIPDSEWKGKHNPVAYARKLVDEQDERIFEKWGPAGAIKLDEGRWLFFGTASS
ncbi:hypothetical protein LCGC14_0844330 [marine sediment metagenome]|uniref:Uncharacterized protein n=1 Tax=marine sediment metagenome TaxID=412755 RepID=A0A0F9PC63_9ZZZZ